MRSRPARPTSASPEGWWRSSGGSGASSPRTPPALEDVGAALAELRGELESDDPHHRVVAGLLRQTGESCVGIAKLEPEGDMRRLLSALGNLLLEGAAEV